MIMGKPWPGRAAPCEAVQRMMVRGWEALPPDGQLMKEKKLALVLQISRGTD